MKSAYLPQVIRSGARSEPRTSDCDVFVLHASGYRGAADSVRRALEGNGFRSAVGQWDPVRPPTCRVAVLLATTNVSEIEAAISSAVYRGIPIFALLLERFHAEGNLRTYLGTSTRIDGASRPLDLSIRELTKAVQTFLSSPQASSPKPLSQFLDLHKPQKHRWQSDFRLHPTPSQRKIEE